MRREGRCVFGRSLAAEAASRHRERPRGKEGEHGIAHRPGIGRECTNGGADRKPRQQERGGGRQHRAVGRVMVAAANCGKGEQRRSVGRAGPQRRTDGS